MKSKGSILQMLIVAALFVLADVPGESSSPAGCTVPIGHDNAATTEESDLTEVYLVPGCRDCASIAEVDLAAGIFSPTRKPIAVESSQLILMDAHGKVLYSFADPYHFDGTAAVSRSASGFYDPVFRAKLTEFGDDAYTAVLKVNGLYSNVATFNVRANPPGFTSSDGGACPGSLWIEPLVDTHGKALPNAFMVYFRNLTDDSVSVAGSTMRAHVLVHGQEYHLRIFSWVGIADLFPGKPWATIVRIPSFVSAEHHGIEVGEQEIQYKFGDCLSNVIHVKVDKVQD
jgi:hypothetical protein